MIYLIISLFLQTQTLPISQVNLSGANQSLSFKTYDAQLMNLTLAAYINEMREQKKLDSLQHSSPLQVSARYFQDLLEFKNFQNDEKHNAKINAKLLEQTKKNGFKGELVYSISGQSSALKYDGKSDFFYDKLDEQTEFKLFYGTPALKKQGAELKAIEVLDYQQFAQQIFRELSSDQQKILLSKTYQFQGIHLQWNYKTLEKKMIPQIKYLIILGGFQTAGIRK